MPSKPGCCVNTGESETLFVDATGYLTGQVHVCMFTEHAGADGG